MDVRLTCSAYLLRLYFALHVGVPKTERALVEEKWTECIKPSRNVYIRALPVYAGSSEKRKYTIEVL